MKALQFQDIDRLELVEIDPPEPGADQVLIRTGAATICTSDLHDLRGNPFGIALPVILGHEGAGTVAAVGAEVRNIAVGDRVAAHPVHPCGDCASCRDGMGHLCERMGHFGLSMQGTFAEFFVARQDRVRRIPDDVEFAVAALAEPVCVCLEALAQTGLAAGQRLLVIGDGPFGVIMARIAGQRMGLQVTVAGHHAARLAHAAPARTVNLRDNADPRQALRAANDDRGYDAAILAVDSREALAVGLDVLRAMGRLVIFAPMPGETPVDLFTVLLRELEIVGAVNDRDRMDHAIEALADPALALANLVTHRYLLDAYDTAFAVAERDRAAMKVAFTFPDAPNGVTGSQGTTHSDPGKERSRA